MKRASVYFNQSTTELIVPLEPIVNDSFLAFLLSDKDLHWCLHNIQIQDEHKLLAALHESTAMAISYGSYKDTFGMAAWSIGDLDTISIISGLVVCPGGPEDHNAYRSELTGLYCIMTILTKFFLFYSIEGGTIELGCNGLSALDTAFDKGDQLFQDIPSYDLAAAILRLQRESLLTWVHRHVKGHQDEGKAPLDTWATCNILMD